MSSATPIAVPSPADLERLRADTPGTRERVHLNNAGAALMPMPVLAAIREHLELEARIGGYEAADAASGAVADAYRAIAELIGARRENVAFVENATVAFAQALSAVVFEPGDRILTTRPDYVSNQIMYLSLARRFGVEVERIPDAPSGELDLGAAARLLDERRPKLVAATHIPSHGGLVQPVEELGRLAREREVLYLVDACQSVGQWPVAVSEIGCDFLAATCRKFLRGPRGMGFLYASDRVLEAGLSPLFPDLHGASWISADAYEAVSSARRFENWEFAYALVLGAGEAARYALAVGIDAIAGRASGLAARVRQGLSEIPGVRVLDRGPRLSAIVTAHVAGWDGEALVAELRRRRINTSLAVRSHARLDFGDKGVDWALRVSPHYYNTEAEIDQLVSAVTELT